MQSQIFKPYQIFPLYSVLKVIGDVKIVLNGSITEALMEDNVLSHFSFALGAGSFSDCACVGESIVLNQKGWISHINSSSHLITITGERDFKSPFLMGIEKEKHPSALLHVDLREGMTLECFLKSLGQQVHAYAFVGCLLFETLSCTYLKKAPIFRETINDKVDKYWATIEKHPARYAYVFGVVVTQNKRESFPKDLLERAFYLNPLEKQQSSLLSHTHAALLETSLVFSDLKKDLYFYKALNPSFVKGVRHVLTDSVIKEGLLALFELQKE